MSAKAARKAEAAAGRERIDRAIYDGVDALDDDDGDGATTIFMDEDIDDDNFDNDDQDVVDQNERRLEQQARLMQTLVAKRSYKQATAVFESVYLPAGRLSPASLEICIRGLSLFAAVGEASRVEQLLAQLSQRHQHQITVDMLTVVIGELAGAGKREAALLAGELFDRRATLLGAAWTPRVADFHTLLHAFAMVALVRPMMKVYQRLLTECKDRPNTKTYNLILSGLGRDRHGRMDEIRAVLSIMQSSGTALNVFTYSTLFEACGRASVMPQAERWWQEMEHERGIAPDAYCFHSMALSYLWNEQPHMATATLVHMRSARHIVPAVRNAMTLSQMFLTDNRHARLRGKAHELHARCRHALRELDFAPSEPLSDADAANYDEFLGEMTRVFGSGGGGGGR